MAIRDRISAADSDAENRERPAEHIAAIARTLVLMGPLATAISTRQRVSPDQARTIRELLPALADRYGLRSRVEVEGDIVAVTFERDAA